MEDGEKTAKQTSLMTTLEVLGNHLHSQITTRCPQLTYILVSKITGILLECGEKEVLAMLQNGPKLQMRISQVLRTLYTEESTNREIKTLPPSDISIEWTDEDSEKLFDKVATIEPVHCAKITERKDDDSPDDKGDAVYSQVIMWFPPKLAEKITGMLLEMPSEELSQAINNLKLLKTRAAEAYMVLKNSGYLTMYDTSLEEAVE